MYLVSPFERVLGGAWGLRSVKATFWRELAALLLMSACSPSYVVVPATGGTVGHRAVGGFTLEAVPNAWNDDPKDLGEYTTPVWVRLTNRTNTDVRVVYSDLALTNESGFRYAVISPYPSRTGSNTGRNADPRASMLETDQARAADARSEWRFDKEGDRDEVIDFVPSSEEALDVELARGRPGGHLGGGLRSGPHIGAGHSHFYGHWGYYTGWPYYYPWYPYYGAYAYYWDIPYYSVGPSEAVTRRGLREGVLRAGGRVTGFVYFQNAATEPSRLDLAWTPRGLDGKSFEPLHVQLSVIED